MNSQICISKKIGYLLVAVIVIVIGVYVFGVLANLESTSFFPQAKETSSFLSSRKKIQNTVPNSVPCGGMNEPLCLTENDIVCNSPTLGSYTKPENKTLNQECRSNRSGDIIDFAITMYPETKNLSNKELIDLFVNNFANNSTPQFQPYEKPFFKNVERIDGSIDRVIVIGIDPGQVCRDHPFIMSEVPEVCPVNTNVYCGKAGQECCIVQQNKDENYNYLDATDQQYQFICENASLICDKGEIDDINIKMYGIYIRRINNTYAEGSLTGSKCISILKKFKKS